MDWRTNALKSLADAREEIEAATDPTFVCCLTITEADLFKERPVSIYANLSWDFLPSFLTFVAWRLCLKREKANT